jgi:hypothetical protein
MPYRSFNPTNSVVVPKYAGNTLKEYGEALDYQQNLYNIGEEGAGLIYDETFKVNAAEQDQGAAKQLVDSTRSRLAELAKSGDYHLAVPEITKMAREFAIKSKPFNEVMQQKSQYVTDLKKQFAEGKINSKQMDLAMRASEARYTGLQVDPVTGGYKGQYSGAPVLPMPNITESTKKAMDGVIAQSGGNVKMGDNGVYVVKEKGEWKKLGEDRIQQIVSGYINADKDWQNYFNNTSQLEREANAKLYEEADKTPGSMGTGKVLIEYKDEKVTTTKKGKKVTTTKQVPVYGTPEEFIAKKGITPSEFIHQARMNNEKTSVLQQALQYAVPKYKVNDYFQDESWSESVSGKIYREAQKEAKTDNESVLGVPNTMLVGTVGGLTPEVVEASINAEKTRADNVLKELNKKWANVTKIAGGRIIQKGPNGEKFDVTEQLRAETVQANIDARNAREALKANTQLKVESGFAKLAPSVYKEAEKEKQAAIAAAKEKNRVSQLKKEALLFDDEQIAKKGQEAYFKRLEKTEEYNKYKELVKKKTDAIALSSTMLIPMKDSDMKGLNNALTNALSGLGPNGLLNARYYSGSSGFGASQLTAKDFNGIGDLEVIGITLTGKGNGEGLVVRSKKGMKTDKSKVDSETVNEMVIELDNMDVANYLLKNPVLKAAWHEAKQFSSAMGQGKREVQIGNSMYKYQEGQNGEQGKIRVEIPQEDGSIKVGVFNDFLQARQFK